MDEMSRLSWIRWCWSDFDGGTKLFSNAEVGQYVRLLHLQADMGDGIPADLDRLARYLGEPVADAVLGKFERVADRLVNRRLADEIARAQREYSAKAEGARRTNQTLSYTVSETVTETDSVSLTKAKRGENKNKNKNKKQNRETEPERESENSNNSVGGGVGEDGDRVAVGLAPKPLRRFVGVFNAAYGRNVGVPALNSKAERHYRNLLTRWGEDKLVCLPILARCFDESKGRKASERAVSHLFHDGDRGAFDWSTLLETAGRFAKGPPLEHAWAVGEQLHLTDVLQSLGLPKMEGGGGYEIKQWEGE